MPLNTRTSMDVRWPLHQRSVPEGHMPAVIELWRDTGNLATDVVWDAETGGSAPAMEWLYTGPARIQDNKDWRARRRNGGSDPIVQHAVRVQIPMSACPPIKTFDIIKILSAPYNPALLEYTLHVRNPLNASDAWVHNVLCDINAAYTGGQEEVTGM